MSKRAFYAWDAMRRKSARLEARVLELEARIRELEGGPPAAVTPLRVPIPTPRAPGPKKARLRQCELFPEGR